MRYRTRPIISRSSCVRNIKRFLGLLLAATLTFSINFCQTPAYAATPGKEAGYTEIGRALKGKYDVTAQSAKLGKVVNCNHSVNVRSGPGTKYKKIGTAPKGAVYTVTGKKGSWYRIIYKGSTGYIYARYLSVYTPAQKTLIEGYYGSWAAYDGYSPGAIPADKLDVVAYAFARLDSNLNVKMGDPDIDPRNFADFQKLKNRFPDLKVTVSIGGWSGSGRFSDAALSSASRDAFAASAIAFMKQYGFDGIDIDWEYPVGGGLSSNKTRSEDKANFTLMMAKLREALDTQGSKDGRHYLLTFAGASEKFYTNNVELSKLAKYVDFALVMTYDIHGPWSAYADFNSPLYTPNSSSPQSKWSCDAAVKLWENCGFPASKIVLGVPFYGYRYTGISGTNNGLYQKFSSADDVTYDKIVSVYLGSLNRYWQPDACVPWLFGASSFISYDDPQSIALKAAFVKQNGLAGAGIWELSQNADGTLLGAVYDNIK